MKYCCDLQHPQTCDDAQKTPGSPDAFSEAVKHPFTEQNRRVMQRDMEDADAAAS